MSFAVNDDNDDCFRCMQILMRDGTAEGWRLECRHCHRGVKIENGKRVYNEPIPKNVKMDIYRLGKRVEETKKED